MEKVKGKKTKKGYKIQEKFKGKDRCIEVPLDKLENAYKAALKPSLMFGERDYACSRHTLYEHQMAMSYDGFSLSSRKLHRHRGNVDNAVRSVRKAILTHDWEGLALILSKWPLWDSQFYVETFVKAIYILLFNHPVAREKSLILEYFHMVLGCRHDSDKKALIKLLITLPRSIIRRQEAPKSVYDEIDDDDKVKAGDDEDDGRLSDNDSEKGISKIARRIQFEYDMDYYL